ncbi:MAG: tetratricopeptide repeat protein, partial [Cyclobacteriaceae bacterium]
MKKTVLFFLLFSSLGVSAQRLASLDSMLLDASYDEVLKLTNDSELQTFSGIQINCRRVQALTRSGKLEEARALVDKLKESSQKLSSNQDFATGLINAANASIHLNEGRNDLALEEAQSSIEAYERSGKNNTLEAAEIIGTLGIIYNVTGKTQQAEEQLLKALSIRREQLPETHELIAATYNDLGLVYTRIDPDKALDYYDRALAVYEKLHESNHPKIAIANTNLGVIYRELEFYGDAVNSLETALAIWEHVYSQPHPSKAFVLSNLAQTYQKMGDSKASDGYYERSLKMYEAAYGKRHPDIASTLNAIGNIRLSNRKYDEALAYYQRALQANVRDFDSNDITINPPAENFYNGNVLLYSLLFKAQAFETKYFGETLKFGDLVLSMNAITKCDSLIENLRNQINNESDKIALG